MAGRFGSQRFPRCSRNDQPNTRSNRVRGIRVRFLSKHPDGTNEELFRQFYHAEHGKYFRCSKRRDSGRYPYHDHELFRTGRLPHQLFHMDYPIQATRQCKQKPSTSTGNRDITRLDVKPGSTSIDYKSSLLSPSPISRG